MKVAQLCPSLCDPMAYAVHGIVQAKILEPFPSPADIPNPGIEPRSPTLQPYSLPAEPHGKPSGREEGVGGGYLILYFFASNRAFVRKYLINLV